MRWICGLCWLFFTEVAGAAYPAFPVLERLAGRDPQQALQQIDAKLSSNTLAAGERVELATHAASAAVLLTDPDRALAYVAQAEAVDAAKVLPRTLLMLRVTQASALDLAGRLDEAFALADAQVRAAQVFADQQAADQPLLVQALHARGLVLISLQDFPAAVNDLNRAYLLAPPTDATVTKGDVASALGLVYEQREENAEALRYFREAETYYRKNELSIGISIATFGIGRAYMREKDWPRAEAALLESSRAAAQMGDRQGVAYVEVELAVIALHRKDLPAARRHNQQATLLSQETENVAQRIDVLRQSAEIARIDNDQRAAHEALDAAMLLAEKMGAPLQKAVLEQSRARVFEAERDFEKAFGAFKRFHRWREQAMQRDAEQQLAAQRARFEVDRETQIANGLRQENELKQVRLDQQVQRTWLWFMVSLVALLSLTFLGFVAYKSRQTRQHLNRLAHTDELTGLANRRHVLDLARSEMERARRHATSLAVAVVDLDHFKQLNDRFGHAAGDAVLKAFAQLCQHELRQHDVMGRIGGEEFFAFFPHTDLSEAEAVVDRLRQRTHTLNCPELQGAYRVSISVGMAALSPQDANVMVLLGRADQALYAAKHAGRDRIHCAPLMAALA